MSKLPLIFTFIIGIVSSVLAQVPKNAEDISPLLIGEKLPNTKLLNADGSTQKFRSILKEKPSVVIFYRGGWCPYCNSQLNEMADLEKEIVDLGFQIIAISPDPQKQLAKTVENEALHYSLFSDYNGELAKAVGIAYKTPKLYTAYLNSKFDDEKVSEVLPVPTVFVVNKDAEILFEYINPNYKVRLDGKMLMGVLKSIEL